MSMNVQNTEYREALVKLFGAAPYMNALGVQLVSVEPGVCVTALAVEARHLQQNGFVHAAVQAALADHTAGGAATTLVGADQYVLTNTYTIHLLRAAKAERLECTARVLRPGKSVTVVESEVTAVAGAERRLVSKATVTLSILKAAGV